MADRWNLGKPNLGDSFTEGFVSPWNAGTRGWWTNEDIATIPATSIPETFAGEMDGDAQTTFTGGKGKGRRKR